MNIFTISRKTLVNSINPSSYLDKSFELTQANNRVDLDDLHHPDNVNKKEYAVAAAIYMRTAFMAIMLLTTLTAMAQVTITGNVYGGGNAADVGGNVTVTIDQTGATVTGEVYGGGAKANTNNWDPNGYEEVTGLTADVSVVTGLYTESGGNYTEITTENTKAAANTTYYRKGKWVTTATNKTTTVTLINGTVSGDVYGGGYGLDGVDANVYGAVTVTVEGGTARDVFGCNNLTGSPQSTVEVNITNTADNGVRNIYGGGNAAAYTGNPVVTMSGGKAANVFGGGLGSTAVVTGDASVTISDGTVTSNVYGGGSEANLTGDVAVSITGGTVTGDVYGGGAKAHTNTANWDATANSNAGGWATGGTTTDTDGNITTTKKTTVSLTGGIVGNAYGGGLGDLGSTDSDDDDTPAYVYGDVTVTVNGTAFTKLTETAGSGTVPKTGRVFGCNNLKGTPKGSVTVTVIQTKGLDSNGAVTDTRPTLNSGKYELQAVYGGGNQAPYIPANSTNQKTKVEVQGCNNSIEYVYGGGNSASVPETDVTIRGAYEIDCVFGGGNGSDKIKNAKEEWITSPGANVTGDTNTALYGGTIHSVFGGSNTKGTIEGSTNLVVPSITDETGCPLKITDVYGAGRNADVDNDVIIEIGCLADGIENVYGGAYNANINGKVQLTITSGVLQNVFGGNDSGGTIKGPISVNIEETDNCKPIKITNLYGAGNAADYPSKDNNVAVTNPSVTVNVKACTSIDNIYGGGCDADVYGNTEVNINMVKGWWAGKTYPSTATEAIPNTIGTIGNVYGGGQNGKVYYSNSTNKTHGNATVNIGTATTVGFVTEPIQYRPSTAPDTELTKNSTTGLYDIPVEGAKIVGDVYGGGKGNATTVDGIAQVNFGAAGVSYTPEVTGNIYGGSAFGTVNVAQVNLVKGTVAINNNITETTGNVFGGGKGQNASGSGESAIPQYVAYVTGSTTVTLNNATVQNAIYGGCNTNGVVGTSETAADATTATVTLKSGIVGNSSATDMSALQTVFGGGLGSNTHTYGKTAVNVGVETTYNTNIYGNVYGGSRNGSIGAVAVDLKAGTIHGNVYGGGYETSANTTYVTRATDAATTVNVTVEGATFEVTNDATDASIIKTGQVFGCNNVTGTPTGHVKVEVKNTVQNGTQAVDVAAVYGGGNQADYLPATANDYAEVLINRTENGRLIVGKVFGGGNAAGIGSTGEGGVAAGAQVTLTDGDIKNGLYGGCNSSGTVCGAIAVYLNGGTVGASGTGNSADVFGGGYGHSTSTSGNIGITLNGTIIYGDLYGGSALGNVNGSTDHTTTLTISSNTLHGTIYGGGQGTGSGDDGKATSNGNVQIDYNIANDNLVGLYGGANVNGHVAGDIDVNVIANVGASGAGNSIDIFGGGLGASTTTDGDVTVTIDKPTGEGATAPVIYGDIYGGSSLGEVGASGKTAKVDFKNGTLNGTIFGGGKGQLADSSTTPATPAVSATVSGAAEVAVSVGSITGGVYGGCNTKGTVTGDITVGLTGGTIGAENARADVFGGGFGSETTTAGNIGVTLNGTTIYGDLYGGSAMGSVNGSTEHTTTLTISSNTLHGTIYGGGQGDVEGETGHSNVTATSNGNVLINYNTANTYLTGLYGGANINGRVAGDIDVNVKANVGSSTSTLDIFGGGYGANTNTEGNVTVTIGDAEGTSTPIIYGDIYGGSALGNVNNEATDITKIDFLNGTLKKTTISNVVYGGNIYGGGLGDKASLGTGHSDVAARVNGKVVVNISSNDQDDDDCKIDLRGVNIYGCNNSNGSPQADVEVHIYKTAYNYSDYTTGEIYNATYSPDEGDPAPAYAIDQVFGGGNQADYLPENGAENSTKKAKVYVHSCNNTIRRVFGGGNAAAATGVVNEIDGGRFLYVYGGGNGKSAPANIGKGGTDLKVHGGKIATLFGGSNTSGTITGDMGISIDGTGCASDMNIAEFFCGNNLANIGADGSPVNITATIGCGTKFGDVYGGCNKADIYGNVTLTIEGGEMNNVYGGSKGGTGTDEAANINGNVTLNIYGGNITNNAYGGSNINGNITGSIIVNMDWSQASTSCNSASDLHVSNVYGASNLATYTPTNGSGNYPEVNIKHGTVSGSVFGGGKGSSATVTSNPKVTIGDNVEGHSAVVTDNVYGGGDLALVSGSTTVTTKAGGSVGNDLYGGGNNADVTGSVTVNIEGSSDSGIGNVYGGGALAHTNTANWNTAGIADGTGSWKDGQTTTTNGKTTTVEKTIVNLTGGTIKGNVYGGGLGEIGATSADDKPAYVYGDVTVTLNGTTMTPTYTGTGDDMKPVTGQIFGCNNLKGTPFGHVTVNVKKTVGSGKDDATRKTYDVAAVYGGGNQADYIPVFANSTTDAVKAQAFAEVVIEGCDDTSIDAVYGGGNAAAVPATKVTVIGSYIINRLYGGGNGKDEISLDGGTTWINNPGANVGIIDPTAYAANHDNGKYGTGKAETKLYGGYIDNVYGGSNTKGDIIGGTDVATRQKDETAPAGCCEKLVIGQLYGAGSQANMEGDVNIILECMPEDYVAAVYGGAENAIINGNVTLTVTSGKFGRVFGGNNAGGSINGKISVIAKEEGCKPLEIGELYGGGNEAPYSIYGCSLNETTGKWSANTTGAKDYTEGAAYAIDVLVESCTSIGKVFGGGNEAEVVGDTHVEINMFRGTTEDAPTTLRNLGKIGQVFGGGNLAKVTGNTTVDVGTDGETKEEGVVPEGQKKGVNITRGSYTSSTVGTYISPTVNQYIDIEEPGVYGGGKQADVDGDATLNIGTAEQSLGINIAGNIFGGGYGNTTKVTGDVTVNIGKKTGNDTDGYTYAGYANITGDVYGGSAMGTVNSIDGTSLNADKTTNVNLYGGTVNGDLYGGGLGNDTDAANVWGPVTVTVKDGSANNVFGGNNTNGTPKQSVAVNIDGGEISQSVYGGGNLAITEVSPIVTITDGTIGTGIASLPEGQTAGAIYGNVYGGGKGSDGTGMTDINAVKAGLITGDTKVIISGGEIKHNVYGGGAYGSVGTFTYDTDAKITGRTSGGKATITVTGGTIGKTGQNNGMVFGSSRGDVGAPGSIHDKLAWVYDTEVKIGTKNDETDGPTIKGSVYGGGENGHNYNDANVYIYSGTIGIHDGTTADGTRGNVYGGGCGTDKYYTGAIPDGHTANDGEGQLYNPLAGIVYGDATITMEGGTVKHNVYGAGAMGSVGKFEKNTTTNAITFASGGTTTIAISGGTVGHDGNDNGNVFGAARGDKAVTDRDLALVKETSVTISGTTTQIKGNVYGGGEVGNVHTNTTVDVQGGAIAKNVFGGGKGVEDLFTCEQAMVGVNDEGACQDPGSSANKDKGTCVTISNGKVGTLNEGNLVEGTGNVYGGGEIGRVEWNTQVKIGVGTGEGTFEPVIYGNVFGAGKGLETHGYSALVRGNSTVTVQGNAKVGCNVYGGGENSTVGRYWVKNIPTTVCEGETAPEAPDVPDGMPYKQRSGGICRVTVEGDAEIGYNGAADNKGHVFGASKGVEPSFTAGTTKRMVKDDDGGSLVPFADDSDTGKKAEELYLEFLQTLSLATNSFVTIDGNAKVKGSVFGGSESGFVQHDTNVTIQGDCEIGTTTYGNVFGGGKGLDKFAEAGKVKGTTTVAIINGNVKGNVYGGGSMGDVGTITKPADYNYTWKQTDGNTANTHYNNDITGTNTNTGICKVTVSGGIIGGNVFGASRGHEDTWWCEKAMVFATDVSVTAGTVKGNVYGGGEVGRVEDDSKVTIGDPAKTDKLEITGSVFGAGAGKETHGYSALVRGNADVIVQGVAKVGGSVFGGGEIASVGRFKVIGGLPTKPQSGGTCTVLIQGGAEITGNVFGACEGVESKYDQSNYKQFCSMQTYTSGTKDKDGNDLAVDTYWNYYPDNHTYVWRYYPTEPEYLSFLKTLALTSNTHVTIAESANVKGSVYGGGELGVTLGGVDVNMTGGTVLHDVYGGGSLADSNTAMWDADNEKLHDYVELDLLAGLSHVTGYFEGENKTLIETPNATAESGKTYYAKYKTNVNLTGGTITHDAYGGGLGRKEYGTKGQDGYVSPIEAMVYGDVKVELNKIQNEDGSMKTGATGCVVNRVFGCNNLNGTPKGKVQVYVYATQKKNGSKLLDKTKGSYDVAAVYGGGNLAAYKPVDAYSTDNDIRAAARPEVYIDGCDLTSIKQVYGGGNAAPAPATYVEIDRAYEIDEAFGGGNGYDNYSLLEGNTTAWYQNPGANVGYDTYASYPKTGEGAGAGTEENPWTAVETTKFSGGAENKANRLSTTDEDAIKLRYGSGVATLIIKGGTVHTAYGGSNSKGNVRTLLASSISSMFDDCAMDIGQSYGGGKNAYSDADAEITADCAKGVKEMFGGSKDADFDGNVNMRITNGSSLQRVFGGNNTSGAVNGFINITIEEGGCEPIRIGELYAGGFLAPYSVYGYVKNADGSYKTQKDVPYLDGNGVTKYHDQRIPLENGTRLYPDPRINVISATYIGNIFGGGYQAKLVGNPHVNVNMTEGFVNVTKTEKAAGDPADRYDFTEDGKTYVYKDVAGNTYDKAKVSAPDPEKPTELIATTDTGTIGNIYGGGNMADIIGNTDVEIGTGKWVKLVKDDAGNYNEVEVTLTRNAAHITGNVFGGGKGKADNFLCDKAMVGVVDSGSGSTNVTISNGTVDGTVYGGGEIGRVEGNTKVTIGTEGDDNSKPVIKGNVYGAGKGLHTHGYSALVRGNTEVIVQGSAKVDSCVYGGGELASVGKYTLVNEENQSQYPGLEIGMPGSFANNGSGKCVVKVRDNAVIGPDNMQMTATGGPDDAGHVFGAGKGATPKVYSYDTNNKETMPKRMMAYNPDLYKETYGADEDRIIWEYSDGERKNVWEYFDSEAKYLTFIETMALATETEVAVSGKAFVKGSVYGGSENGFVQHGTEVTIEGGQIGAGENMSTPYDNDQFVNPVSTSVTTANALKACTHWDYEDNGATYDMFAGTAGYDSKGGATTAKDGHTFYGNVFGGGSGYYPYAPGKWHNKAGSVGGNTVVNITGGHILSNVYGGNEQTDVGTYSHGANDEPILADGGKCTINMSGGTIGVPRDDAAITKLPTVGHLYGAGKGDKRILFNTWTNVGSTDVNVSGGIIYGNVYGGGEDGHVTNLAKMTVSEADPTNKPTIIGTSGTSGFDGDVFGGGQGSVTALTAGVVGGDVNLKVEGGNIKGSVYGGGRLASVGTYFAMAKIPDPNDKTKEIDNPNYGRMQDGDDHGNIIVSLTGGTVNKNVFGGCMGSTTNDALGVSKNVTVNLNGYETKTGETTTTTIVADNEKGCVVKGSVFGCNNLNSSPLGSVLVHVYGTQKDGASQIANTAGDKTAKTPATKKADGDYDLSTFDLKAVYGGGNLAAYKPQGPGANLETYDYENTTHYAEVIIDGCERTSIGQVYGGGNAASTPATKVTVNGSYEIGEVFGGGNGKDAIGKDADGNDIPNPGANVGFYDYSTVEATYDTKEKRQQTAFTSKYVYGSGKASVNIFGGTVHRVFGGSNTKGNVRLSAITLLEEEGGCEFCVDEAYGGGKSAPMDAEAKLLMSCIPGLKEVYGGAQAADVYDNVSVTITNGTFNRVFGGNNLSGTIRGSITVNVEETGCRPVVIGELYGGGNLAGYSVYGYDVDNNGKVTLKQSGDTHWNHPQVNVKAFTSIGNIYGGGYGANAVMVGDPTVNINVAEGDKKDYTFDNDKSTYKNADNEDVPYYDENGFKELTLTVDGHEVSLPSHAKGKIGAINNVFGGGNAAKVIGNTNVNVGTEAEVYMVKEVEAGASVSGLYTRTGEGTTTSPYVYNATESTATAVDGTTYYVKKTVLGADIRGNVYGGGNAADVTGRTNVVIGKE